MRNIALAALTALALAGPGAAAAQSKPPSRSQPSSYAPTPSGGPHVYGSPIGPPIVGPARPVHRPHATSKHASATTAHEPHGAAAKHHQPAPVRTPI